MKTYNRCPSVKFTGAKGTFKFMGARRKRMALTKEINRAIVPPSVAYSDMLMMEVFLDMLMDDAIAYPSKLIPYTQEMMDEEDELLARVTLDP
jgi:hypothetical protein